MDKTKIKILFFLIVLIIPVSAQKKYTISSKNGLIQVDFIKEGDAYNMKFSFLNDSINNIDPDNPVYLEVRGKKLVGKYTSIENYNNDSVICLTTLTATYGSKFSIKDVYFSRNEGIEVERTIDIVNANSKDNYFNSFFGFEVSTDSLINNEYFIPGVWYKGNFDPLCNLPIFSPQSTDTIFYYREDRITLPLVMFRNKKDGTTITIIHKDSDPQTVMVDNYDEYVSEYYQYGALGIQKNDSTINELFIFPGSEATRRGGRGYRYHPVKEGITHKYTLFINITKSDSYAEAQKNSWLLAFNLYQPPIYSVNLSDCYNGLIETLDHYYVPNISQGGIRDVAGFPFEVGLDNFLPRGIDYKMGFVGMQIATAYYLYREGVEKNDLSKKEKGETILNFWANNCLSALNYPRTWYDPGLYGATGRFRPGSDLRDCTEGLEALFTAWCFAKRNNISRSYWLNCCKKFGDWLVLNQNEDGSYYFSYNHQSIINGKHPVSDSNKYLTICPIRYLVELYIATSDERYKTAALKAGEFCLKNIHEAYRYIACVVDNPRTIDSESGLKAMNSFMSLYDLTKDPKWLIATQQAAAYTESWVYSFEIPVENDRSTPTSFPRDRSIIGQHLIAIGHGAADLGFAWCSFIYYRLYLETNNEHYLYLARLSAHNTKQSMNWDQSLYPGAPKGLQLEAFPVTLPRRSNGVETTLNWNYAAHLDPMFRFKDAFGTPDLEEVIKMPFEDQKRLIDRYSKVQSSDYGQSVYEGINNNSCNNKIKIYPNPIDTGHVLYIEDLDNSKLPISISFIDEKGIAVYDKIMNFPYILNLNIMNLHSGIYALILKKDGKEISYQKILIK